MKLQKICVFCGGKVGKNVSYENVARRLGVLLAKNNIQLIYGAGNTGLMKFIASNCKSNGGYVVGFTIRELFDLERPDLTKEEYLNELHIYSKLSIRKFSMISKADVFCVLPGGLGTIDEISELMVLKQLGIIKKPIIIVNINNFFTPFYKLLKHLAKEGFLSVKVLRLLTIVNDVEDVIPQSEKELMANE